MNTNDPMPQERLDAIRARLNRSTWTEGEPWDYAEDEFDGWCVVVLESGPGTAYVARGIEQGWDEGENDAALIAHAPRDLAALLAEVERLRALTTVDDAMVKRAAGTLFKQDFLERNPWADDARAQHSLEQVRVSTPKAWGQYLQVVRAALDAAHNPEEES